MLETAYALIRLGARTDILNANHQTALECSLNEINRAVQRYHNFWRRRFFLFFLKSGGYLTGHKHSTELTYETSFHSDTPAAHEAVAFFSKLGVGSQFDYQIAPGIWTTAMITEEMEVYADYRHDTPTQAIYPPTYALTHSHTPPTNPHHTLHL